MSVKLISVTPDAEKRILYVARVSSDQSRTGTGLLSYLIRNKHWSPFEMASMVMEVETSRDIAHQMLRHRSFSFQEFSQRYAKVPGIICYPGRRQAEKNRQSSVDALDEETQTWWMQTQTKLHHDVLEAYEEALSRGIARECARFILPGSTKTKVYLSGTVRSWIHYLELRGQADTQLEHRVLVKQMRKVFAEQLPVIAQALEEAKFPRSRTFIDVIRTIIRWGGR